MFKFKHIFVAVFMILQFLSSCSLLTNEQVKETEKQTIDFLPLLSNKAANGRTDATLVVELDTKQNYLVFKDTADFNLALQLVMKSNPDLIVNWEKSHSFASLNKLYEKVVNEQSAYLKSLKLTEKPSELPLCDLLKSNQDKFIISPNTGIDMKVTIDAMAYLVNANNLVKIGNQIIQYNYDNIKVIENGDASKVAGLVNLKATANGVFVGKVERTLKLVSDETKQNGGRTEELTNKGFCDSYDVNRRWDWRVLGYVEEVKTYYSTYYSYSAYIKLRSLEWFSSFWSWGWSNYSTTALMSNGYVSIYSGSPTSGAYWYNEYYSTSSYSSSTQTRYWYFVYLAIAYNDPSATPIWNNTNSFHNVSGANGCQCQILP